MLLLVINTETSFYDATTEEGNIARYSESDGAQDLEYPWAITRLRNCPANRTDQRRRGPAEPGNNLSGAAATGTDGLDQVQVGRVRK